MVGLRTLTLGAERASITYSSEDGGTSQVTEADLPWTKEVDRPTFAGMFFAYVSAQNWSEGVHAIVTCQE